MFEDDDFEAGHEFMSDFIISLSCRIYLPGSDIIQKGDKLGELYLIYKGTVSMAVDSVQGSSSVFLILPTHSYFGDY